MPVRVHSLAWLGAFCLTAGSLAAQAPPPPAPAAEPISPLPPAVVFSETPQASVAPDWHEDPYALLGPGQLATDVRNLRECWAENGLTARFEYTQFYQGVVRGGLEQNSAYGSKFDKFFFLDGGKAGLWEGLFVDVHIEGRLGNSVNGNTGALSAVNLPMLFPKPGDDMIAMTGFKITQALSENFAVFAGKINTLDGFKGVFSGERGITGFQNMSFVFNPVFARTIPYSSLGAGAAVMHEGEAVASLAVFDAQNTPTQSGFNSFFSKGAVIFGDINIPISLRGLKGHQGLSATWSSRTYGSLDSSGYTVLPVQGIVLPGRETGSWSLAYRFDQYLYEDPCHPGRGWGMFGQYGISDGNPNPVRWFASAGVGGNSLLPGRGGDTFGTAYYFTGASSTLVNSLSPLAPIGNEQGLEFFYNVEVTKWFRVTPDLQVIDPLRQRADPAVVTGVRAQVVF
jgi:porin